VLGFNFPNFWRKKQGARRANGTFYFSGFLSFFQAIFIMLTVGKGGFAGRFKAQLTKLRAAA
jgi:hypothetical protein